ncbi:hypothetical protein ACIBG8_23455 [Nonomuraea sp. NPDC050556]|uniref:hypothetical protein n=1 Tax=Nonomuraea sp. NPDC050556 TaxID=3364369 RepID=UPI0037AAA9F0
MKSKAGVRTTAPRTGSLALAGHVTVVDQQDQSATVAPATVTEGERCRTGPAQALSR